MTDVVYVVLLLLFFGGASLFVSACERIVGRVELPAQRPVLDEPVKEAA